MSRATANLHDGRYGNGFFRKAKATPVKNGRLIPPLVKGTWLVNDGIITYKGYHDGYKGHLYSVSPDPRQPMPVGYRKPLLYVVE